MGERAEMGREEVLGDPAVERMLDTKKWTLGTRRTYSVGILDFCRYAGRTPSQVIDLFRENGGKAFYGLVAAWIKDRSDKIAPKTLKNFMLALRRLVEKNVLADFDVDDEELDRFDRTWRRLVKVRREVMDYSPAVPEDFEHRFTHEQIVMGVKKCKDNRERVLVTLLASSGLRIEAALGLEVRDIEGFEDDDDCYRLLVRKELSKNKRAYYTFITRECRDYIKDYLEERRVRGDQIGPNSKVIVTETFRGRPRYMKGPIGKFRKLSRQRAEIIFRSIFGRLDMLETTPIPGRSGTTENGFRYNIHPHRMRYWFKTEGTKNIDPDKRAHITEFLMGHRKKREDVERLYAEYERYPEQVKEQYHKCLETVTFAVSIAPPGLQRQVEELNKVFARLVTYATAKDPELAEQLLGEKPSYEDLKKIIATLEGLEAERNQKEEKS